MKEKLIEALTLVKEGEWDGAHKIVQDLEHPLAYWIHAYLHRMEPDPANASYWYTRANKPHPNYSYEKEWNELFEFISANIIIE